MKNRAIDIVFDNKHIDKADTPSGKDGFMQSLEFWSHVYMILSKKKVANIKQTV